MKNLITIFFLIIMTEIAVSQNFWEVLETPPDIGIHSVDINSNNDIFMGIAFSPGGGVLRKINQGNGWDTSLFLSNDVIGTVYIDQSNNVFAASDKIYYSNNNGNNWNLIYPGQIFGITSIFKNSRDNIFFGTWGGIFKSDSTGSEWVQVLSLENVEVVNSIIEDTLNGYMYAGSTHYFDGGGIYRSIDSGETWEHFGLYNHYVSSLAFNSMGDLFVGTRGHNIFGTGGVFKLPYGQSEFINVNNVELVTSILNNSEDNLFIGCSTLDYYWGGVRRSMDNGQNWEDISLETMYDRDITAMFLGPLEHLYAFQNNSPTPLYKSVEPTITSITEAEIKNEIYAVNFPNPFSGFTEILYKLDKESAIQLEIFNYTGQIIQSIELGLQSKGIHKFVFDAGSLINGIYFCSLKLDGKTSCSVKMTLIK